MAIRNFEQYTPQIAESAFVDESAVVTGNVVIGADSSVWPMCSVRGDIHSIRIGERTNIQDGSILHVTHDSEFAPGGNALFIGNDVTVGHGAVVHACTVEDMCLIGMGSVLLDGAVVKSGAIVGAFFTGFFPAAVVAAFLFAVLLLAAFLLSGDSSVILDYLCSE